MTTKTIDLKISELRQGWSYIEFILVTPKIGNPYKLKIYIEVDTYDFQSSANINVWNPESLTWNYVYHIHYSHMTSIEDVFPHHTKNPPTEKQFKLDRDELFTNAVKLLW